MKKYLLAILAAIILFAGCEKPKNYVNLHGKIDHLPQRIDSIFIFGNAFKKSIALEENGTFSDTFNVKEDLYAFVIGNEQGAYIFLKNGEELQIDADFENFEPSLTFSGKGVLAGTAKMILNWNLTAKNILQPEIIEKDSADFYAILETLDQEFDNMKLNNPDVPDSLFLKLEEGYLANRKSIISYYKNKVAIERQLIGSPALPFTLKDINGETINLSDLKGKYVYINLWITQQDSHEAYKALQPIISKYADKNISFINLCLDNEEQNEAWKDFVKKNGTQGIQILSDQETKMNLARYYQIMSTPRFILIDPEGNINNAFAPNPTSPGLENLLDTLPL